MFEVPLSEVISRRGMNMLTGQAWLEPNLTLPKSTLKQPSSLVSSSILNSLSREASSHPKQVVLLQEHSGLRSGRLVEQHRSPPNTLEDSLREPRTELRERQRS